MAPTLSSSLENEVDDQTVKDFIYGSTSHTSPSKSSNKSGARARTQSYSSDEFLEIPVSTETLPPGIDWKREGLFYGQESYSSFGDKGTTASINACGSILQISRYLGVGTSGIFCVDPGLDMPLYLFDRTKKLLDLSTERTWGFGLYLDPQLTSSNSNPRLKFLHNRWPCYSQEIGDLSVSIQYFANRGAVIQQYLFHRATKVKANNDMEEPDALTSRGSDGCDSQEFYDGAGGHQPQTCLAQNERIQDDQKQNDQLSRDHTQQGQVEQKRTQERSLPRDEEQTGKTFSNTHKKMTIRNCLKFETQLQIYESEWENYENKFNMDEPEDEGYQISLGQNGYSLVVNHQIPDAMKTSDPTLSAYEAVGLVTAVFVNGHATKIAETQDENGEKTYEIQLDSEDVCKFDEWQESEVGTTLEITAAYHLRLMAKGRSWESTLIPASVLDLKDLMSQNSYASTHFLSQSVHLDFILMRHLEHILSVCSIPVSNTPKRENESIQEDIPEQSAEEHRVEIGESEGGNPVALTCGDISGHLVLTSASFFAFQFLLAVYCHLQGTLPWIPSVFKLAERIFETIVGHLEWVFLHIKKDPSDSGQFLAKYWANGREGSPYRFREYPTTQHTSLQIIKAKDFASAFLRSGKIPNWFLTKVDDFFEKWISSLRKSDNRDYCVFPRVLYLNVGEGYHLRDHVLIWKALETTDVLEKLRRFRDRPQNITDYAEEERKREFSLGIYTSEQARRSILKRFTTQTTTTNERMIAIYRDTQSSSFLLGPMDTILFYYEQGFFDNASKETIDSQSHHERKTVLDEWVRTLEVQPRHERTDDKAWHEPRQYALAIQMGEQGRQIDDRPASDAFDEALKILLQSCSASGIFPGLLTCETKPFAVPNENWGNSWSDWNSYWHTSFELPYMLWMYAKKRLEETSGQDLQQPTWKKPVVASQRQTNRKMQFQRGQPNTDHRPMPKMVPAKTALMDQDFIDQKNILEISDEWLTPCPEFLHFNPKSSPTDLTDLQIAVSRQTSLVAESRWLIVDIPKRKYQWDNQTLVDPQPRTNKEFFDRLQQWRTKESHFLIRKRIVWTSSDDQEAAEMCFATVPYLERPALRNFFGRHKSRHKYFLDHPSARDNSWKTEFQLSFYELGKQEKSSQSKPEIVLAKRILQGSMGFRFNGDFFDRYWTCHILTSNNREIMIKGSEDPGYQTRYPNQNFQDVGTLLNHRLSIDIESSALAIAEYSLKRTWYQRKVLELILFEEVIRNVTAGTKDILQEISKVLASEAQFGLEDDKTIKDLPEKVKETVLFSKIDSNAYFSFSAQWEVLQQLLQVLDEDLSDAIKKIHSWQDREESRGKETPRWTKKDEKRYRPALRRMQISNAESVRELLQLQEKIQSLRASLISRRDYIRDDLNLRGAENTRYFTYVTVVFLPLGFATGIFSMSETPAGSTLARMSGTAVITFALTVIVLYFVVELLEAYKNLIAALIEALARVKWRLEKVLLPFWIAYVMWRGLGGSINNFVNNQGIPRQETPPPQNSNDRDTGRRDPTVAVPVGNIQGQPAGQRRPASLPGDLENQIGSRHPSE